MSHSIKHQTINIFQVKHIRGILFDDTEKSSGSKAKAQSNAKNQSIHLEIKPIQFLKPTNTATVTAANKKAKLSQDDSAVTYKLASIEPLSNNKIIQQKFSVVARSTSNEWVNMFEVEMEYCKD